MSTGERRTLKLVTNFADLRAGMLVLVKGCRSCLMGDHETMLLRLVVGTGRRPDTGITEEHEAWIGTEKPLFHSMPLPVPRYLVAERRLYLIDTGARAEDTTLARTTQADAAEDAKESAHNFAECGREDCDLCADCGSASLPDEPPCPHSRITKGCASCWRAYAAALSTPADRLP